MTSQFHTTVSEIKTKVDELEHIVHNVDSPVLTSSIKDIKQVIRKLGDDVSGHHTGFRKKGVWKGSKISKNSI